MTKKQCPLGEDCDLTLAWMMGADDARDKAKARIEALEAKLAKAVEALDQIAGKAPYADDPYDIARAALAELKGDKT
jgi:outer membrane protein TolC